VFCSAARCSHRECRAATVFFDLDRAIVRRHLQRAAALAIGASLHGCSSPSTDSVASPLEFGHPDSVLFWTPEQQLAGFPNYDRIFDTRLVAASRSPLPLEARPKDSGNLTYSVDSTTLGLSDFLAHNHVHGLIVVHRGDVVLEEYVLPGAAETTWVSYSVAKSVVSLLFGAAIQDGHIGSVDDPVVDYVPLLEGTAYEGVRIRDLLQMSSGVAWNEDYTDPTADVSREIGLSNVDRLRFLGAKSRVAPPGSRFNYNTGETHLAGAVLRSAIGDDLATYLHEKIWDPFGMESDANWRLVEPEGAEHGGCCLSASLRDYARLGLFALSDGVLAGGERVLPEGWMTQSTSPSAANAQYGYLWWLRGSGRFSALGIFGQMIHVDPALELVIATHSAWPEPVGASYAAHRSAFIQGVRAWVSRDD